MQRRKVHSLSELAEFDLVINCLGLGAKQMFNDDKLHPVRLPAHTLHVHVPVMSVATPGLQYMGSAVGLGSFA